jgi:hypothetical protein
MAPPAEQCLRKALQAVRDVAIGAGPEGEIVLATFDESAFPAARCLAAAGAKPTPTPMKEGAESFELGGSVLVHEAGVLLCGNHAAVEKALEHRGANPFPARVSLQGDEFLVWVVAAKGEVNLAGNLEETGARLRARMDGDVPSSDADELERAFQAAKGEAGRLALSATEAAQLRKLLDAVDLHHDGSHMTGSIDLQEPVSDQAKDLGALAAVLRAIVHETDKKH